MNIILDVFEAERQQALAEAQSKGMSQGFMRNFRQGNDVGMTEELSHLLWFVGMLAEIVIARYVGVNRSGDVGEDVGDYQVKSSLYSDGHLAVAVTTRIEKLHPNQVYILATPVDRTLQQFIMRGWSYVVGFAFDEFLDDMNNPERELMWKLPNDLLKPIGTLPRNAAVDMNSAIAREWKRRLLKRRENKCQDYNEAFRRKRLDEVLETLRRSGQWSPDVETRLRESLSQFR